MEFDKVLKSAQHCLEQNPTIILGSGASAAYKIPGMPQLGNHLSLSPLPLGHTQSDSQDWGQFVLALSKTDLESALTEVRVSDLVLRHIIDTTWKYLNSYDLKVYDETITDRRYLALSKLFDHLFASTATEINVVTPNYDRIAEYAAEASGHAAFTGFNFGCISTAAGNPRPKVYRGSRQVRTVNVWKVHGSFGWFIDKNGVPVSLPPRHTIPEGMTPAIVTPGVEKYRLTYDEPFRSAMHSSDDVVRSSNAFFCVGFGFNDPHMQTLVNERCGKPNVPIVLITKSISQTAHRVLTGPKCLRYLAIEEFGNGTRVFSNEEPAGVVFENQSFWSLDDFLELTV